MLLAIPKSCYVCHSGNNLHMTMYLNMPHSISRLLVRNLLQCLLNMRHFYFGDIHFQCIANGFC